MTKRGFTLIELSIVLVILGLIVGGIVGGQSLIKAAGLQSVIRDWKGYQTAVNAFRLQYDAMPGDFAEGWDYWDNGTDNICGSNGTTNSGCNGTGDGVVGYVDGVIGNNITELSRAWVHLQLAEIIPPIIHGYDWTMGGCRYREIITQNISYSNQVGNTVPMSKYADGAGFSFWNPISDASNFSPPAVYGRNGLWIVLARPTNGVGLLSSAGILSTQGSASPADAAALDKKLDDGKPATGNVITSRWWASAPPSPAACTNPSVDPWVMDTYATPDAVDYELSVTTKVCNPMFFLGD